MAIPKRRVVYATHGENVLFFGEGEPIGICSQEEADTRVFVHLCHSYHCGHMNIMIRTTDSDLVALAIFVASQMKMKLCVAYGQGEFYQYFDALELATLLGPEKSKAWNRWDLYPDVTNAFLSLTSAPKEVTYENIQKL